MRLLSLFTDRDDICFWRMSLSDGALFFPRNAKHFFGFGDRPLPTNIKDWISGLVVPEDRLLVREKLDSAIADNSHISRFSFRIRSADGKLRWIEQRGAIGKKNSNPQITWLSQDITDKLNTAHKFEAVFNNADVGLALVDTAGNTIAMNKTALKTLGLNEWSKAAKPLANPEAYFSLHYPDGREITRDQWPGARAARGEYVNNFDAILTLKKTGQSRYIKLTCAPVYDASGEKMLSVYSINDLTETRRLYEALSQSRRLEALGQLAGGIAHDFNNVLSVIAGNLELIADSIQDERNRTRIRAALDAAEAGASFNRRLLTIARKRLPMRERIDIVKRIRSMTELLERTIGKAITLDFALPENAAFADVDPGELDAAFLNLITNSRDAMPDGGTLSVSITSERDTKNIILTVRDTGSGMTPDILRMAAEPFFTTKQHSNGSGLGLTGVYAFANEYGGRVDIDSRAGVGTEVRLSLPNAQVENKSGRRKEACSTGLPHGNGQLILVAEDDTAVRQMTCQRLQKLGYSIEEAQTGDEALARVSAGLQPACIFSDIDMPGRTNGIKLAEKLGRRQPRIPVVLCTGYHEEITLEGLSKTLKNCAILPKPYSLPDLAHALHGALSASGPPMKT